MGNNDTKVGIYMAAVNPCDELSSRFTLCHQCAERLPGVFAKVCNLPDDWREAGCQVCGFKRGCEESRVAQEIAGMIIDECLQAARKLLDKVAYRDGDLVEVQVRVNNRVAKISRTVSVMGDERWFR